MMQEPSVPRSALIAEMTARLRSNLLLATIGLSLLYIALVFVTFYTPVASHIPEPAIFMLREVGGGILLVALATALLHRILPLQHFENRLVQFFRDDVRLDLAEQASILLSTSSSLDAIHRAGILRVYPNRDAAIADIRADLESAQRGEVRLIGISLRDFTRPDRALYEVWRKLWARFEASYAKDDAALRIKVLLADPSSAGVILRSEFEATHSGNASGVMSDVRASIDFFAGYRRKIPASAQARFDFRLYRVTPQLFMCQTDTCTYFQPHYFGDVHAYPRAVPVFRCAAESGLHPGLREHFDTVWRRASVSGDDYLVGQLTGVDRGVLEAGIANIYPDPMRATDRIRWVIKHSRPRLYLKGIALRSYLDTSRSLYWLLNELLRDQGFELHVLLLDPECEQAHFRSYRESSLKEPGVPLSLEEYLAQPELHRRSKLVDDTQRGLRGATELAAAAKGTIEVRLYKTAPGSFLLMNEKIALIEQYHYGRIPPQVQQEYPTLGKDMPLIEFSREVSFGDHTTKAARPYELLRSDFEFAWKHARVVAL